MTTTTTTTTAPPLSPSDQAVADVTDGMAELVGQLLEVGQASVPIVVPIAALFMGWRLAVYLFDHGV